MSPYRTASLARRAPAAPWWRVAWALCRGLGKRLRRRQERLAARCLVVDCKATDGEVGFRVPSLNLAIDLANAAIAKAEAVLNGDEERARQAEAEEDAARDRLVDAAMPKRP